MPRPKSPSPNRSSLAKRVPRTTRARDRNARSAKDDVVFLNVGITKQSRAGLNKLVGVLNATSQRDVLEQLIATELHRRNLRLPRAA